MDKKKELKKDAKKSNITIIIDVIILNNEMKADCRAKKKLKKDVILFDY